ncbi:hypothetical protein HYS93_02430 [Candidatus Daviesbacteria bacterium]|nr:hypothetical protein [Candidatus Daviesbacteria bacterium]
MSGDRSNELPRVSRRELVSPTRRTNTLATRPNILTPSPDRVRQRQARREKIKQEQRRALLGIAGAATLAATFAGAKPAMEAAQNIGRAITGAKPMDQQPVQAILHPVDPTGERTAPATGVQAAERPRLQSLLDNILTTPLNTPQRFDAEKAYADSAQSLSEINQGLWTITDWNLRIGLLDKRYALRDENNPNHQPLTKEQADWADKEYIHPETLAITIQARELAQKILAEYISKRVGGWSSFRPDLAAKVKSGELPPDFFNKLSPGDVLINPGGMARMVVWETGQGLPKDKPQGAVSSILSRIKNKISPERFLMYGFVNIGFTPARSQIDANTFLTKRYDNKDALSYLAGELSKETGLNFTENNLPGSSKVEIKPGDNDNAIAEKQLRSTVSGGAVGLQMMPEVIANYQSNPIIHEAFKRNGLTINPYDPVSATTLGYLFLAQSVATSGGNFQYGFLNNTHPDLKGKETMVKAFKKDSLLTWNRFDNQVREVLDSEESFRI